MRKKITGTVETIGPVSAEIDPAPRHSWGTRLLVGGVSALLALGLGGLLAWWGM